MFSPVLPSMSLKLLLSSKKSFLVTTPTQATVLSTLIQLGLGTRSSIIIPRLFLLLGLKLLNLSWLKPKGHLEETLLGTSAALVISPCGRRASLASPSGTRPGEKADQAGTLNVR
eukprot:Lithocolla_globosa_v1_NODE_474_length_3956_cov_16.136632.p2 type:complete len:115 gc:universal NODE_474_length_3956_cov_16.136632:2262-2606(+)